MLSLFGASFNFFSLIFGFLFITIFDTIIHSLLGVAYNVFLLIANVNIFGAGGIGEDIYNTFTSRLYTLLSVIMVFVFAYFLLTRIIDPDAKKDNATNIVKETAISLIALVVLPLVYNYMGIFQSHVLTNNTIPALVLGDTGTNNESAGSSISLMLFLSYYHPAGTNYSTFFDDDGNVRAEALSECTQTADSNVCENFVSHLQSWQNASVKTIGALTSWTLLSRIGEDRGMEYLWIIGTLASGYAAWLFISYAIDLGTRAVKLAFLQLITPIPLILRIFPNQKKSYESWYKALLSTYVDVFLRVAIVCFIVQLALLAWPITKSIFKASSTGNPFLSIVTFIIVLLGLLKFAKDAPKLIQDLFSKDGLGGISLKAGVRSRIKDNSYAMAAASGAVGFATGGAASAIKNYKKYKQEGEGRGDLETTAKWRGVRHGITGFLRGGASGARYGATNQMNDFNKEQLSHVTAGAVSQARANEDRLASQGANSFERAKNRVTAIPENIKENWEEFKDLISGENGISSIVEETSKDITSRLDKIIERSNSTDIDNLEKLKNDLVKDLRTKGTATFMGKPYDWDHKQELIDKINEEIRKERQKKLSSPGVNDSVREQLKNIYDYVSKNGAKLGPTTMNTINQQLISKGTGYSDLDKLLEKVSDKSHTLDDNDIKALLTVNSTLKDIQKNYAVAQQIKKEENSKEKLGS